MTGEEIRLILIQLLIERGDTGYSISNIISEADVLYKYIVNGKS